MSNNFSEVILSEKHRLLPSKIDCRQKRGGFYKNKFMYKPELVLASSFTLAFVPLFFLNSSTTSVKRRVVFNIDIIQIFVN